MAWWWWQGVQDRLALGGKGDGVWDAKNLSGTLFDGV